MIIEKWEKSDNGEIALIEKECFRTPWTVQMLDDCFARSDFFGVKSLSGGVVTGYVGAIVCGNEAEILNLAVKKEFRKTGIGFSLMERLLDLIKKNSAEKVFLEVRKSNLSAIGLYEKLGFEKVGERKKYYENTEDALIFVKVL